MALIIFSIGMLKLHYKWVWKSIILDFILYLYNNCYINYFLSFRENMQKYSAVSKDTPDKPLDRAVWWTEYVLRHNGAPHLRSSVLDLKWYQYLLLDVIGFLSLVILVVSYLTYIITQRIFCCLRKCCSVKHDDINANSIILKKSLWL